MPHAMNRRQFIHAAGAVAAGFTLPLSGLSGFAEFGGSPKTPNILFVLADQWRFSAFSHESDIGVKTPVIDKLAMDGARWRRCYSSNPVCTPNRAALITGRFSHQTGMIGNDLMLPPEERCLGNIFHEAGYATHYIGKWHMDGADKPGYVPPGWRRRGFQTFEGFNRGHWYGKKDSAQYFSDDGKLIKPNKYEPTYQTDLAIQFMRRNQERPFLCFLSWGPPHNPYNSPEWIDKTAIEAAIQPRANVPEHIAAGKPYRTNLAGYYGCCQALDQEMGRLLQTLDELKLAENTLVVFTADHGDMLGSHGLYFKEKPEEESCHVPLVMRFPAKIRARQLLDLPASSVDVMPTIAGLAGLGAQKTCSGRDLSAAVSGLPPPPVSSVYAQGHFGVGMGPVGGAKAGKDEGGGEATEGGEGGGGDEWRLVATASHKLVVRCNRKSGEVKPTGLFDLGNDPCEMKSLLGKPEAAAVEKQLADELQRWAAQTKDPFPGRVKPAKRSYDKNLK